MIGILSSRSGRLLAGLPLAKLQLTGLSLPSPRLTRKDPISVEFRPGESFLFKTSRELKFAY